MARLHLYVALTVASLVLASAKKSGDVTELQIGVKYKPKSCTIQAHKGDRIKVHYRGSLTNGEVFDSSFERGDPIEFELGSGQVIKGWDQGILGMCVGEKRKLKIPAKLGYGAQGSPPKIPEIFCRKGEIFTSPEMYCGQPDKLLDLNWNQGKGPGGHLESAMSSIVPSRSTPAADGMAFHQLMGGRLTSADDGASQQSRLIDVRLNSPNKLNLSMPKSNEGLPSSGIPTPVSQLDQFSGRSYGHHSVQLGLLGAQKLSRVSVLQIGLPEGRKDASAVGRLRLDINNGELISGREESSASDPAASGEVSSAGPSKKRKAPPEGKVMGPGIASASVDPSNTMEEEDSSAKRCRFMEKKGTETDAVKPKEEENGGCSSNGYDGQKQG